MVVDSEAAVRFLEIAFEPADWVALLLKWERTVSIMHSLLNEAQ
jgi:hypothetical protein